MDTCKVCGRRNPIEQANFCFYCGASLREGEQGEAINRAMGAVPMGMYGQSAEAPTAYEQPQPAVMPAGQPAGGFQPKSFGMWRWFLTFSLLLIPVYGWIAFAIAMMISAFGGSATEERKNFARGMLLFLVLAVGFLIVSMIVMMQDPAFRDYYQQMLDEAMKAAQ